MGRLSWINGVDPQCNTKCPDNRQAERAGKCGRGVANRGAFTTINDNNHNITEKELSSSI